MKAGSPRMENDLNDLRTAYKLIRRYLLRKQATGEFPPGDMNERACLNSMKYINRILAYEFINTEDEEIPF